MSAENSVRFLSVPFTRTDFLINRQQCSSSVYIGEPVKRATSCTYLQEGLLYRDSVIPLFSLNLFLEKVFLDKPSGESLLALIRERNSFSPDVLAKLEKLEREFYGEDYVTPGKIAFRIASATVMSEIPVYSFRVHPPLLAGVLEKQGFLAVSFSSGGRIGCVIDLDVFFGEKMLAPASMEGTG